MFLDTNDSVNSLNRVIKKQLLRPGIILAQYIFITYLQELIMSSDIKNTWLSKILIVFTFAFSLILAPTADFSTENNSYSNFNFIQKANACETTTEEGSGGSVIVTTRCYSDDDDASSGGGTFSLFFIDMAIGAYNILKNKYDQRLKGKNLSCDNVREILNLSTDAERITELKKYIVKTKGTDDYSVRFHPSESCENYEELSLEMIHLLDSMSTSI